MLKIISWFSRAFAAFLRLFFPLPEPQKEVKLSVFYSPNELSAKLQDRNFQLDLIEWVNYTLKPMEDNGIYLAIAKDRPADLHPLSTDQLRTLMARLEPYIVRGTPAHDLGHHIFDALGGAALISSDPFIGQAYRNEIDAAFIAAMSHDICTGVQHRYIDNLWELDHGEIGAWIVYHALEGLVSEPVRRLVAYAIAAHPHKFTKQGDVVVYRWQDELFYDGETPVRIAVWIARWTDRLENGADDACHLPRHALASLDGARVKVKRADGTQVTGQDLHGVDIYSFSDALRFLFTPALGVTEVTSPDGKVSKVPSMLQHLRGYANSAVAKPYSAYNQHDHLSPVMEALMAWKVKASAEFIDAVLNTTGTPDFNLFVALMQKKSGLPNTQMTLDTIVMVEDLWNQFSPEEQAHWAKGFELALVHYDQWLNILQDQISQATDPIVVAFQPLVPELVARVSA